MHTYNLFTPPKTIKLNITTLDGNAFSLMAGFSKQARKEQWTVEEVKKVTDECMQGDYCNLVSTLMNHIK